MWILLSRLVVLLHFAHLQLPLLFFGLEELVERVDAQVEVNLDADQEADAQNSRETFEHVLVIEQHFEALRDSGER